MYADLYPIGIAYPELMIDTPDMDISTGSFCFYKIHDDTHTVKICAGTILSFTPEHQKCNIHCYQQANRPTTKFQPLYAKKKPICREVPYNDIVLTTMLDSKSCVPKEILRYLANNGTMT